MTILINSQPAVIKADTAFDYIAKNPFFDNKDDFTLQISFPIRGCLANRRIFGLDETIPGNLQDSYRCTIIEGGFRKTGTLKVLAVTTDEVQAQFALEGVNAGLDTDSTRLTSLNMTASYYTAGTSGNFHSVPVYDRRTEQTLDGSGHTQIWLHALVAKAIRQLGWECDDSPVQDHYLYRHLLILNPIDLGAGLGNVAKAMPDWTVRQLLDNTERLCAVRFIPDYDTQTVRVVPLTSLCLSGQTLTVTPEELHEVETLDESELPYWKQSLLRYADLSGYDSCQWFIDKMEREGAVTHFNSLSGLADALAEHLQPVAGNDAALGRTQDATGYTYTYPGDPDDEAYQTPAFQQWQAGVQADMERIRQEGYARQFATQVLEAGGRYFLVAEAQTNCLYMVMRRLIPLNRLRDSGTPGEELTIAFTPAQWHNGTDTPVIETPEPALDFDPDNDTPPLVFNILQNGEKNASDTAAKTLWIALCHTETVGGQERTLLWTDDLLTDNRLWQVSQYGTDPFAVIGTTETYTEADGVTPGSRTIVSPLPRYKDGELLGTDSADLGMPYTNGFIRVPDRFARLFPFTEPPAPFPTLALHTNPQTYTTPLQVTDPCNPQLQRRSLPAILDTRKYTFAFLYKGMPDPKAVYRIRGRRYICSRLTARVTPDGVSELKKGEFWLLPPDTAGASSLLA